MTILPHPVRSFAHCAGVLCGALSLAACSSAPDAPPTGQASQAAAPNDGSIALSAQQMDRLGIRLVRAEPADAMPLASVPAIVTLPPEARVAVTTPFAGTAVQVLAIAGQEVRKGAPLAILRAGEAVQYGAALARAEAQLPVAGAQAARLGQLSREGIIAPARADEAGATLAAARANVAENRRLLALAGAGRDGTITLRAPISGRIASASIETGAVLTGGAAPFVVENTARLRLDLQIPERMAGQVRPGMAVWVEQDGHMATGRILSVGASIDPQTRALAARASLDPGAALVPGKSVMATIAGQSAGKPGVWVPAGAVAHIDGADVVFVRASNGLRRLPVAPGAQSGERIWLPQTSLPPGSQIAATGIAELKSMSAGQ